MLYAARAFDLPVGTHFGQYLANHVKAHFRAVHLQLSNVETLQPEMGF